MADPGAIGGDLSHEFHLISESGDNNILYEKRIGDINNLDHNTSFSKLRNLYSVTEDEYNKKNKLPLDKLIKTKGIEVGHIFYFGTKYSDKLGAYVLDNKGKKVTVEMGSYGIGISRLVAAVIESSHDNKGIIWPKSIAPFKIGIINLKPENKDLKKFSDDIYNDLKEYKTIYDDTNNSPGEKFATMDLIGIPLQIIIGENYIKNKTIEVKERETNKIIKIKYNNTKDIVKYL